MTDEVIQPENAQEVVIPLKRSDRVTIQFTFPEEGAEGRMTVHVLTGSPEVPDTAAPPVDAEATAPPAQKIAKPGPVRAILSVLSLAGKILFLVIIAFIIGLSVISSGLIRSYRTHLVVGGSMAPTINYGDIVIVKTMPGSSMQIGDIILFKSNPDDKNPVMHRVISITAESCIQTQGDFNQTPDPDCAKLVAGRAVFWFPRIGLPIIWVSRLVAMTFGRAA
jgi:signal peptidase I